MIGQLQTGSYSKDKYKYLVKHEVTMSDETMQIKLAPTIKRLTEASHTKNFSELVVVIMRNNAGAVCVGILLGFASLSFPLYLLIHNLV